jgi:hypothetical protein
MGRERVCRCRNVDVTSFVRWSQLSGNGGPLPPSITNGPGQAEAGHSCHATAGASEERVRLTNPTWDTIRGSCNCRHLDAPLEEKKRVKEINETGHIRAYTRFKPHAGPTSFGPTDSGSRPRPPETVLRTPHSSIGGQSFSLLHLLFLPPP